MAYFQWADDMVIDNGPIDADHRHLVDLVNQLHTATSEGRGVEIVGQILEELIRYTSDHLRREEAQMEAVHFPNLEGHRKGHAHFVNSLRELQQRYEAATSPWRHSSPPCCATGFRCTSAAPTRNCSTSSGACMGKLAKRSASYRAAEASHRASKAHTSGTCPSFST